MIYSSVAFLLTFPVFCVLYWLVPSQRVRWLLLLVASFAFYAYGEPRGLPLLIFVICLTYLFGIAIVTWRERANAFVLFGVAALILDLAFFKYATFFGSLAGVTVPPTALFMPLGLSFFTFEAIAYLIDLKRRVANVERSPVDLGLFIAVFPHLISGPIMRPNQFLPQLKKEVRWHLPTFVSGLQLFVEGLVKKVLVADPAGLVADRIFAAPHEASTAAAWLAAMAYTVQIYGDFAGYTDMGRGAARMIGLELPLNFNAPYTAHSIADFWRRWHISLSSWLRDYLYISLGGNRHGSPRTYVNLIFTMLLGGLWHGAGLTFVAWGGYHGVLLVLERITRWPDRLGPILGAVLTLLLVMNGWVLFRAHDFGTAAELFRAMYVPRPGVDIAFRDAILVIGTFAAVLGLMIAARVWPRALELIRWPSLRTGWLYGVIAGSSLVFVLLDAAPEPFIYFRF